MAVTGAIELYAVVRGIYEDRTVVAVFTIEAEAQSFADHMNTVRPARNADESHRVEETIPFYRPGAWVRPKRDALTEADNYCAEHGFFNCQYEH
jgi:hypothetical protein